MEKQMAVPNARVYGMERGMIRNKTTFVHMRRAQQATVESVRPAMIGTLYTAVEDAFRGRADACATVPADVIESAHRSVGIADDDDTFVTDFAHKVCSRPRDGVHAPGTYPALEEKAFDL